MVQGEKSTAFDVGIMELSKIVLFSSKCFHNEFWTFSTFKTPSECQSFRAVDVIINLLLVKNHCGNILTRTTSIQQLTWNMKIVLEDEFGTAGKKPRKHMNCCIAEIQNER